MLASCPSAVHLNLVDFSGMEDSELIERIIELYNEDAEDPKGQSRILVEKYRGASAECQEVMDNVTICICGWSIKTILSGKEF